MSINTESGGADENGSTLGQNYETEFDDWGVDWMQSCRVYVDEDPGRESGDRNNHGHGDAESMEDPGAGEVKGPGTVTGNLIKWFNQRQF
jgi:hypothetical protein